MSLLLFVNYYHSKISMSLLLFEENIIFLSWQYFGEILSSYCDNFDIIVLNSDLDIFLHYVDLFIKYIAIISIIS